MSSGITRKPAADSDAHPASESSTSTIEIAHAAIRSTSAIDVRPGLEGTAPASLVEDHFSAGDPVETAVARRRRRSKHLPVHADAQSTDAVEPVGPLAGGNGVRTLIVRTASPGEWNLRLHYAHAYDPHQEPLLTYELKLNIQPTPNTAFRIQRLASDLDIRLPGDPDDSAEFEVA